MNIFNLFRIALIALSNNKMRAFLTMLGIIIGIASVISMLAIGQGSKASINKEISSMGSNMIMVHPGSGSVGGVKQDRSAMETLKLTDYEYLRDHATTINGISPVVSANGQYIYSANNYPSSMMGVSPDYLDIRQLSISDGEMFGEGDIQTSAKVCVVGQTIVENLFTNGEDPIGKIIRFNKIPFKIIGVLTEKGYNTMGRDQDDIVLVPYSTVMKRLKAIQHVDEIFSSAFNESESEQAIAEITSMLRKLHKLKDGVDDDFNIRSQEELASMMNSTSSLMTTLLVFIASISLLVGGVGIMNIMYVSVTERTKEIGLRMSVGARGVDILNQFLIESTLISITGGIIGIFVGFLISNVVAMLLGWPIVIETWTILLSFAVCTITGIFFGWYPAKKAAQLNPIDAIRYE